MPPRLGPIIQMELLSMEERLRVPSGCQRHWYGLAARLMNSWSVLDVGAGTGTGLSILRGHSLQAEGIDPLPAGMDVQKIDISNIATREYDGCVCIDVIEHVADDVSMLKQMCRVARKGIFISTPNWDKYHASNPFHFREYTWIELIHLIGLAGRGHRCQFYGSDRKAPHRVFKPDNLVHWHNFGVFITFTE